MTATSRTLLRRLADWMVFIVLLVMVLVAMREIGWLDPERGRFIAIDGDSLRKDGQEYRLHAIDAPELSQTCQRASGKLYPCGREARDMLRRLVTGRDLSCQVVDTDRYKRLVADCMAGSLDINDEMVRRGWAVAYIAHGSDYRVAEGEARAAHRGIWEGPFEQPESWRARHRAMMRGSMADDLEPD